MKIDMRDSGIANTYFETMLELVKACEDYGVEIESITKQHSGFQVFFKGVFGDAICNEFSRKSDIGNWETMNFPWDMGDVSSISTATLVDRVWALQNGYKWDRFVDY